MSRVLKRRRTLVQAAPVADINTTPLIDVMLVLLVMLIITIPVQLHSVNLNLPVFSQPTPPTTPPEVLRVDVEPQGVLVNGELQAGAAALQTRLQQAAAQETPPEVHVRPHPRARYERFAEVMVAVHQAGLHKLGVVGGEQFIESEGARP